MIKVGQLVKITFKPLKDMEGVVTKVLPHDPKNPIENHGTIEILVSKSSKDWWGKIGDKEHFCHYEWQKHMTIIKGKK